VNSSSEKSVGAESVAVSKELSTQPELSGNPRDQVPKVTPTLSTYFGATPVSVSAFLKAVKGDKISGFSDADIGDASNLMIESDPDGTRILALVSQPTLPEAVERCVWQMVQARLKLEVPAAFEGHEADAGAAFRLLHDGLNISLLSAEKAERRKGENFLRLGLSWLISKRSLDPWVALELLKSTFYRDSSAANRTARRILARGKLAEIKSASGIATLAHEKVRTAQARREEELQRSIRLQAQLDASQKRAQDLESKLENSELTGRDTGEKLLAARRQLEEFRQHTGHDMDAVKSQHRVLLTQKLLPLLNDAIDALEIVPAAPTIALGRIKSALLSIQEVN
jgi:hypothetical protein